MKKIIAYVVLLTLIFSFFSCQNVAQKFLELTAEQYNKQCPMLLNEFIRVDKCEAAPNRIISSLSSTTTKCHRPVLLHKTLYNNRITTV